MLSLKLSNNRLMTNMLWFWSRLQNEQFSNTPGTLVMSHVIKERRLITHFHTRICWNGIITNVPDLEPCRPVLGSLPWVVVPWGAQVRRPRPVECCNAALSWPTSRQTWVCNTGTWHPSGRPWGEAGAWHWNLFPEWWEYLSQTFWEVKTNTNIHARKLKVVCTNMHVVNLFKCDEKQKF